MSNKTTVLIIRHGERDNHKAELENNSNNPDLTSIGVLQAQLTGKWLDSSEPFDFIYTSPFRRTVQTTFNIVEAFDRKFRIENGLSEWINYNWFDELPDLSKYEKEIEEKYPKNFEKYSQTKIYPTYPEDGNEVVSRYVKTIKELSQRHVGKKIVIVTHGMAPIYLPMALAGKAGDNGHHQCGISKFVKEDNMWKIEYLNSTKHLLPNLKRT